MAILPNTLNESLRKIRGRALSSVEFVLDYVQLRFDGPTLTAYTWPCLSTAEKTVSWGEEGYRDTLCARIGVKVKDASVVEGTNLAIYFEDDSVLRISLRDEDYRSIEAVYFVNEDGSLWVV